MPTERRPFHETIVDVVDQSTCDGNVCLLLKMIRMTKIPANHDAITQKLKEGRDSPYQFAIHKEDVDKTIADLLEQKREAEARAAEKGQDEEVPPDIIEKADSMFQVGQWPI